MLEKQFEERSAEVELAEIEEDVLKQIEPFRNKFKNILKRLSGQTFESHEKKAAVVATIHWLTRTFRLQLLYNNKPVVLLSSQGAKGRGTGTFQLRQNKKTVYAKAAFPSLEAGSLAD